MAVRTLGPMSAQLDAANGNREFETMTAAGQKSKILAAIMYLSAALALLLYLRPNFYWIRGFWTNNLHEVAALPGGAMLLVSSIRVFFRTGLPTLWRWSAHSSRGPISG